MSYEFHGVEAKYIYILDSKTLNFLIPVSFFTLAPFSKKRCQIILLSTILIKFRRVILHLFWRSSVKIQIKLNPGYLLKYFLLYLKNLTNLLKDENLQRFSQSLEHFFLRVGQNNFRNKIPFLHYDSE